MKPQPMLTAMVVAALAAHAPACADTPASLSNHDAGPTPAGQPRSFQRDVIPIIARSCAQPSCHGDTANPDVKVLFSATDPDALYMQMTADSPTAKGAKLIVPGDPAKSYLYAKMIGDQDSFASMCAAGGCGTIMPPGSKVSTDDRATVQTWIMEGAKKD